MNLQKKIKKLKKQVKKLEEQWKQEQEQEALHKLNRAFCYESYFKGHLCKYEVGHEIFNAIESIHEKLSPYVIPYTISSIFAHKECKYQGRRIILNPLLDGNTIEMKVIFQ